jgi:hypothetical protein
MKTKGILAVLMLGLAVFAAGQAPGPVGGGPQAETGDVANSPFAKMARQEVVKHLEGLTEAERETVRVALQELQVEQTKLRNEMREQMAAQGRERGNNREGRQAYQQLLRAHVQEVQPILGRDQLRKYVRMLSQGGNLANRLQMETAMLMRLELTEEQTGQVRSIAEETMKKAIADAANGEEAGFGQRDGAQARLAAANEELLEGMRDQIAEVLTGAQAKRYQQAREQRRNQLNERED